MRGHGVILPTGETGTLPSLDEESPGSHKRMFISALGQLRKLRHRAVRWLPWALRREAELGCSGHAAAQPTASRLPPKPWKFEAFVC